MLCKSNNLLEIHNILYPFFYEKIPTLARNLQFA